jgi:hypothetical protein
MRAVAVFGPPLSKTFKHSFVPPLAEPFYGASRIRAEPAAKGVRIGRKRVVTDVTAVAVVSNPRQPRRRQGQAVRAAECSSPRRDRSRKGTRHMTESRKHTFWNFLSFAAVANLPAYPAYPRSVG